MGIAKRCLSAQVYAFDIDARARTLCDALAGVNGVSERVHVEGVCTPQRLQELLAPSSLVICDCEGGELAVLDPDTAPLLRKTRILVELHDFLNRQIRPTIISRFSATHDVILIDSRERKAADHPDLSFLEPGQRELALSEFRPESMQWAYLKPKEASPPAERH